MTNKPAILFYCQHSLEMGHLVRSFALADRLAERFRVMLLNGGRLPKGMIVPSRVQVVNLPPLGLDDANQLVSHDKRISVERALVRRKKMIGVCFENLRPAVVLIDLFPFGRNKFAPELLPLLETARTREMRALVVCSLRDILVHRQQQCDDQAAELANDYFDLLMVHSDPAFARFEESVRPSISLTVPVKYTGFVVPRPAPTARLNIKQKRIVVSAGGGIVGESLLRTAIEAHKEFEDDPQIEMKVIAGPFLPDDSWQALQPLAREKKRMRLVRYVSDLCSEMSGAAVSISQAGYNTCLDVVRARVPALLVPFARNGDDEQRQRASRLAELGAARVLPVAEQTPQRLAAEIRELIDSKAVSPPLDLNGAQTSLQLIESMLVSRSIAHVEGYSH